MILLIPLCLLFFSDSCEGNDHRDHHSIFIRYLSKKDMIIKNKYLHTSWIRGI